MSPPGRTLPGRLVKLYPDPFRDHWGGGLEIEARSGGWRAHLDLLVGIVDMWLHPTIWPADSRAQRRGRAATMGAAVSVSCWFLAHLAVDRDTTRLSGLGTSTILTVTAVMMLGGLIVISPRPYLSGPAVGRIVALAVRRLAVPGVLAAIAIAFANTDLARGHGPLLRNAVLGVWWLSLAVGAVQFSRLVAGLSDDLARPPSRVRLQVGMWILAASSGAAGLTILALGIEHARVHALSAAVGLALILLAAALVGTLRDIHQLPAPDRIEH